jgi:hypothetical protein
MTDGTKSWQLSQEREFRSLYARETRQLVGERKKVASGNRYRARRVKNSRTTSYQRIGQVARRGVCVDVANEGRRE